MPPTSSGSQPRPSRYASFAARLKDAHTALRDERISAVHRAELSRRVFAITALASAFTLPQQESLTGTPKRCRVARPDRQ